MSLSALRSVTSTQLAKPRSMPAYLGGLVSEKLIKRSVCLRQLCSITACTRSKQARVSATLHAWREEDK